MSLKRNLNIINYFARQNMKGTRKGIQIEWMGRADGSSSIHTIKAGGRARHQVCYGYLRIQVVESLSYLSLS